MLELSHLLFLFHRFHVLTFFCPVATFCRGGSVVQMTMSLANQKDVPAYIFMDDQEGFNPLLSPDERELV